MPFLAVHQHRNSDNLFGPPITGNGVTSYPKGYERIGIRTLLSKHLIGRPVSPPEVSNANRELIDAVKQWHNRDLSHERITYIFVEGRV